MRHERWALAVILGVAGIAQADDPRMWSDPDGTVQTLELRSGTGAETVPVWWRARPYRVAYRRAWWPGYVYRRPWRHYAPYSYCYPGNIGYPYPAWGYAPYGVGYYPAYAPPGYYVGRALSIARFWAGPLLQGLRTIDPYGGPIYLDEGYGTGDPVPNSGERIIRPSRPEEFEQAPVPESGALPPIPDDRTPPNRRRAAPPPEPSPRPPRTEPAPVDSTMRGRAVPRLAGFLRQAIRTLDDSLDRGRPADEAPPRDTYPPPRRTPR
jgi:hypothetical protein